jgi:hypothetical protein
VLDGALEEFFFCGHGFTRISTFGVGSARVLCEFNREGVGALVGCPIIRK